MKKAIKIALITMTVMFALLGSMHWFKNHQEEKRLIRQDQERVAQYILDNIELVEGREIKKIKFLSFEIPPTTAQTWRIDVEINDKVVMILKENKIGDELRFGFYTGEVKFKKMKKVKDIKNIELIYLK